MNEIKPVSKRCNEARPLPSVEKDPAAFKIEELLVRMADENNSEQAGPFQQARTTLSEPVWVAIDLASMARNTRSIFNSAAPLVTKLGFFGGFSSMIAGLFMITSSYENMMKSRKIGDTEGEKQAFLKLEAGLSMFTIGLGFVISKTFVVLDAAKLSSVAGNAFINPGAVLMYLFFLMKGACEAKVASAFCSDLNKQLMNNTDAGVQFVKGQLFLTEDEINGLDLEAAKNLQKTRLAAFERCAGKETMDAAIESFKLDRTEGEKLDFIEQVRKANFTQIVKASLLIFIGVIGLAAVIAGIVFTGPLPFIMAAVVAGLWLTVDKAGVADKLADALWRGTESWLREKRIETIAEETLSIRNCSLEPLEDEPRSLEELWAASQPSPA